MAKQSPAQQKTVARVMHAFEQGGLERSDGAPVEDPKQAIAIALHEAGASRDEDARTNARNFRRTKRRKVRPASEPDQNRSKAELDAEARKRELPGRPRMSKSQLAEVLTGSTGPARR